MKETKESAKFQGFVTGILDEAFQSAGAGGAGSGGDVLLKIIIGTLKRGNGQRGFRNVITGLNNLARDGSYAEGVFAELATASLDGLPTQFQQLFAHDVECLALLQEMAAVNVESEDLMSLFLCAVFEHQLLEQTFPIEFASLRQVIAEVRSKSTGGEFHDFPYVASAPSSSSTPALAGASGGFFGRLKALFHAPMAQGRAQGRAASVRIRQMHGGLRRQGAVRRRN